MTTIRVILKTTDFPNDFKRVASALEVMGFEIPEKSVSGPPSCASFPASGRFTPTNSDCIQAVKETGLAVSWYPEEALLMFEDP